MKTAFDLESLLFSLLNGNTDINGGVYPQDERPSDSKKEDICINTIFMEADAYPLIATSNVNIYVPDKEVTIEGRPMRMPNKQRMRSLTKKVLKILRSSVIDGCMITPMSAIFLNDSVTSQHYVNIRIQWNINK